MTAAGSFDRAAVAVVTGGGRGIGGATSRLLARRGWDLCIAYVDDAGAAEDTAAACRTTGRRAVAVRADVASDADVVSLFETADGIGPVGALVNNAAMVLPPNRVDECEPAGLSRLMLVNAVGPFLCAREAVRRMSSRYGGSGGSIVNVSSIGARHGAPGEHVDYAATKGALDSMTVGLAKEVAAEGIRVNAVRPGAVATDIHLVTGDAARAARRAAETPLGRAAHPTEIAAAIAWLCSDEASFVVGAIVDVSGGR